MASVVKFDPDVFEQSVRWLKGGTGSLPDNGQIVALGKRGASSTDGLHRALNDAENGLREHLGNVLQVIGEHAEAWKWVAQQLAAVDGDAAAILATLTDAVATTNAADAAAMHNDVGAYRAATGATAAGAATAPAAPVQAVPAPPVPVAPQQPPVPSTGDVS